MPSAFADILPVGSLVHSMLSEAQFQTETSTGWVLADGRTASGTRYNTITGNANVPNCQGRFLRARDAAGSTDPDGTVALGTLKASQNLKHVHDLQHAAAGSAGADLVVTVWGGPTITTRDANTVTGTADTNGGLIDPDGAPISQTGSNDARPLNIIVNVFIRVN